jgi:DNA-binding transcriptional MocR family regulator
MNAVGHSTTPTGVLDDQPRIDQIAIVRSLAYTEPDPDLFPSGEFWHHLNRLRLESRDLLRYNWPQGDAELRSVLASMLRERGVEAMPDDILVTAGMTQGVALAVQALTRPGDTVAVERPTHLGLLNSLRLHNVQAIDVPMDRHGPRLDELERIIVQYRPRFFHTMPAYQNPTGTLMSVERRRDLLALARRHRLMIVEDDSCGHLDYDGDPPPALKAADDSELVIYLTSTSKIMMPGLRVGWAVVPRPLHEDIINLRRSLDFCGPPFVQRALANFIKEGDLKRHLRRIIPVYRERRDTLLHALATHMPPDVRWTEPSGGYACWLTLPAGVDAIGVHRAALRRGFAFTPGDAFLTGPDDRDHLRICFASQPPEVITEAVTVLARTIAEHQPDADRWAYPGPLPPD